MSDVEAFSSLWDSFPGGHLRDRAAVISAAIELGEHDEGQADEPAIATVPLSRLSWTMTAAVQVSAVRNGYRFAGLVQQASPGQWGVVGIATPETPSSAHGGAARAAEILDQHAHEMLGVHDEFGYALLLAERFVLHASLPTEHCSCEGVVTAIPVRSGEEGRAP